MEQRDWEVVVIGAGAAGLLAAYGAARRGLKTLLLEKNRKIGVKILMSGGTRCNITHDTDARGVINAFGRQGRFLHSALASLNPQDLRELLGQQGVATKVEATGKVFPVSDHAADVRDALVRLVRQTGCQIMTDAPVIDVAPDGGRFRVSLDGRSLTARALIVTTGGKSYPGCGTVGDGYAWAQGLGHSLVPTVPALAPLVVGDQWPRDLRGVTIEDVRLTVIHGTRDVLEESRSSFLFTHFGFSGPAPMNVSRAFGRYPPDELKLCCDFWPEEHFDRLRETILADRDHFPTRAIASIFRPQLSRRLVEQILRLAGIDGNQKSTEVSHKTLTRAVNLLKRVEFRVQGTRGFPKAEVTAGGIELAEVDSSTMQSKRHAGLYFAGEILNLDGPIGGYNFQSAFSTGWLAGHAVAPKQ